MALGQPPLPMRLIVGLLIISHMYRLFDEQVAARWVENPYWQYFCGYNFFQFKVLLLPCNTVRQQKLRLISLP
ncbi:hypothetical protein DK880_00277 [Candidatus Cardinium hertigii]|uniref:Transposase InsH N-terminal domain-containing protein n=1 Tax=Candidatus Cardinium hertigii TaxID=247481 RepID=A0A2Z3L857_9BACT|nr:hypothetical protein DK880_00277 [Candidatus Cardinium hertigii]